MGDIADMIIDGTLDEDGCYNGEGYEVNLPTDGMNEAELLEYMTNKHPEGPKPNTKKGKQRKYSNRTNRY